MPRIIYVAADGREHVVEADAGLSAMQVAVDHRIPGIDGDCGGVAACGTCHVYVDAAWADKTGPATPGPEREMLALMDSCQPSSRLACQIQISSELDGLVLRMPAGQH